MLDAMIFSKIKNIVGGKVRLMMTGGDYISAEVIKFLKISFCVDILELYGMTETCGASCVSMVGDSVQGIVGGPLQNTKIRLKDIETLDGKYSTANETP
jgi:long-chain acyl-CoA synthetase